MDWHLLNWSSLDHMLVLDYHLPFFYYFCHSEYAEYLFFILNVVLNILTIWWFFYGLEFPPWTWHVASLVLDCYLLSGIFTIFITWNMQNTYFSFFNVVLNILTIWLFLWTRISWTGASQTWHLASLVPDCHTAFLSPRIYRIHIFQCHF